MKRTIAVLLAMSLLLTVGCGSPMPKIQTGKVTVTVAESDGTAVKGATITLTNIDGTVLTATADPTGTAVFEAVAYGSYDVATSMSGYANGSDTVTVDSSSQNVSLAMESNSADSSRDGVEVSAASALETLASYRYKWTYRDMNETGSTLVVGSFEKPDREYVAMRDSTGKSTTEFYRVGETVRIGSGNNWKTLEGADAKGASLGRPFVSTLSSDYSFAKAQKQPKKSDGGWVNGYSTDQYVYQYGAGGVTTTATAWIIKTGDLNGIITRFQVYAEQDGDTSANSNYTMDITDIGKPLDIKLP
jgi:hypothetical protein